MNATAVRVLSAISGIVLFFGCLTLLGGVGASAMGSCSAPPSSYGPCEPVLQEVDVHMLPNLTLFGGFLLVALIIGLPAWIAGTIGAARQGVSSKAPIVILSIVATALLALGVYISLLSPFRDATLTCLSGGNGGPESGKGWCVTGPQAGLLATLAMSTGFVLLSLVLTLPAWVIGLVRTARIRRWGWFTAVLLFSPIAAIVYGLAGPE